MRNNNWKNKSIHTVRFNVNHNKCNYSKTLVKIERPSGYYKKECLDFSILSHSGVIGITLTLPQYATIKLAKYMKQLFGHWTTDSAFLCSLRK